METLFAKGKQMTRPKTKAPKYRYHVSGQAFVEFNGKRFYLGKFDTQKSRVKYHRLVTEYLENGLQTPDSDPHLAGRSRQDQRFDGRVSGIRQNDSSR